MKKIYLTFLSAFCAGAVLAQNSCEEAFEVAAGFHTVDTVVGEQIPMPICAGNGTGADHGMWYKYQPTDTFSLLISTSFPQNDGVDTRVHLYTGDCGNLECVGGDDDAGSGYTSIMTANVFPENSYYIAFDDRWDADGFDFFIFEGEYIPPPPPVPTLFSFTPQPMSIGGSLRGAFDMNGDFLDDVVAPENSSVNIAVQTETGFDMTSVPTEPAENSPSWSMAGGDVDGNGWNDLVYGGGQGASVMLRTDDGSSFTQISSDFYIFSQRSNMVDIDNDGNLDVFVCHDVQPNTYFMNNGDTLELIQGGLGDDENGGNYGSIWTDFDNDGDIDMFIAKCRGGENVIKINEMHQNNGDGTYTEVGEDIGLADPVQTWSSAWGDYDNDGDMDVFVGASSFADGEHKLMINDGEGNFEDITVGSGLEDLPGTSIEWVTHDFDNDGYLDVMGGGGYILKNNGDMTFTQSEVDFWNGPMGDLNNDGFVDVISNGQIYMNDANENNYLVVNVEGTEGNVNGIGSRITVYTESFSQIREIRSGDGFRYMSSLNAYFGLGQDTEVDSVIISWPSGLNDIIYDVEVNVPITATEGMAPLSVDSEIETSIKVYPNPAINDLFIDSSENLMGNRMDIFDVQGKMVKSEILNSNRIDVSGLESGNYILQTVIGDTTTEAKFYKK